MWFDPTKIIRHKNFSAQTFITWKFSNLLYINLRDSNDNCEPTQPSAVSVVVKGSLSTY